MEYPQDLLPKNNYKIIQETLNGYSLIRKSPPGEIFDPSTKMIKNEFLVPSNFHNRHFLNWSCNLYGPFKTEYFKYRIISNGLNEYWSEDRAKEPESPVYNDDFKIDEDFGSYFLSISKILFNLKIPYDKYRDGQTDKGLKAVPHLVHCPTLANFWHFEIRWKDNDDKIIAPGKKSAWVKSIYNSVKNAIRQFCKRKPHRSTLTEVPENLYIKI